MSNEELYNFSPIMSNTVTEIRSSLTMVMHTLEKLNCPQEHKDNHKNRDISHLQYETARIGNNIDQLFDLYKIHQKEYPLHIIDHPIADFLNEQISVTRTLLHSYNVDIEQICDNDLVWFIDHNLVAGSVKAMLANASRYTKDKIIFSAQIQEPYLKISIEDNGRGYPDIMLVTEEEQDSILKNHQQNLTHQSLLHAWQIAQLHSNKKHQGYITVENGVNLSGGCFSMYLP